MIYIKRLLLGLLLIFPIVLIFNQPGIPNLENFYLDTTKTSSFFHLIIRHPPGIYIILSSILKAFPPNKAVYFFYNQTAWIFSKLLLFFIYYITFFSITHLSSSVRKKGRIEKIDLALSYFGSVSILLVSVALSFYDILAAPFFILSISSLFRKKANLSAFFFLIALCFNWSLLILGPLFFVYILNPKKPAFKTNVIPVLSFVVLPTFLFITNLIYLISQSKSQKISSDVFGFTWLLDRPFTYISTHNSLGSININLGIVITIFLSLVSIVALIYLIRRLDIIKFFIVLFLAMAILSKLNLVFILLMFLFISCYWKLILEFRKKKIISKSTLVGATFSVYLVYTLFFPSIPDGNLIWISILSLIVFVINKGAFSRILLLTANLIVFVNMFVFFGSAGNITVRGEYFLIFQSIFSILSTIFAVKYITTSLNVNLLPWLKKFLIIFLIALNFSLLTADGTGDNVSFNDTAVLTVKYTNPFKAASIDLEMYPPLSTAIISAFANTSKIIFGEMKDYRLAVKASIIVFYFLTLFVYYKFSNKFQVRNVGSINKFLVMLTTFSLIVQTQGFSDVNIYVMPTLVAAIATLFSKRYLLGGLLFGLTIMIKPQPIFILPLIGATLFTLRDNFVDCVKKSIQFFSGLIIIPIVVWLLVIINPGGMASFNRFIDYIFNTSGFHLLSGQALNLNWVVTYLLHIFQPERHYSLQYLGWYNWQIPSDYAPFVFRGLFFYIVALAIYLFYWIKQKKNLFTFLEASTIIFLTHFMLNKSSHEKHLFYTVITMLLLYLIRPTTKNRYLLYLFDTMTVINLIFFYGFTGPKDFNRLFLNFDLTVLFAVFNVVVYITILANYFKGQFIQSLPMNKRIVARIKDSNA